MAKNTFATFYPSSGRSLRAYGLLRCKAHQAHNPRVETCLLLEPPDIFAEFEHLGSASNYLNEISGLADHLSLFEDLRPSELQTLCGLMNCFGSSSNMTLFNDGDAGEFLIIILTGKIQVIKHAKSIATVGPGEYLGEMSLIDGAPRFASCVTLEPTDFAVLTRQALVDILLKMPRLGNKLLLVPIPGRQAAWRRFPARARGRRRGSPACLNWCRG